MVFPLLSLFLLILLSFTSLSTSNPPIHYKEDTSLNELESRLRQILQSQAISLSLQTIHGKEYFSELAIGSNRVKMNFTLDSASSLLWFPTQDCHSCKGETVRYNTSSSASYHQLSHALQSYKYDGGEVKGYPCEEQVWLTDSLKIGKMPCLAVTEQANLEEMAAEGVLGLSPISILDLMQSTEIIQSKVISFLLRPPGTLSTFTFGGINGSVSVTGMKTATLPLLKEGQVYSVSLHSSSIGKANLFHSQAQRAVLSSGTGLIGIPSRPYQSLLTYYYNQTVYLSDCGRQKCTPCNRDFHDQLVLTLGNYNFSVHSSKLWRQRENSSYCELQAYEVEGGRWILGTTFLQDYLVTIDYEREEVSLTGRDICPLEEHNSKKSLAIWIWVGVLIGVLIVGIIGIIGSCWCCRMYQRRQAEAHIQLSEVGRSGESEQGASGEHPLPERHSDQI